MSSSRLSLLDIAAQNADLSAPEIDHIQLLLSEWTLISDLGMADLLLWLPTWKEAGFIVAAQLRPTTERSHIPEDLVGRYAPTGRHSELDRAYATGEITLGKPTENHDLTQAIPVLFNGRVIAVLGRYSAVNRVGRLESVYVAAVGELLYMVSTGEFPRPNNNDQGTGGRGGAPRVGDGVMLLDGSGVIEFASPNARSAFRRLGFTTDIEGETLAELVGRLNRRGIPINDTLSLVARGSIQGTSEIESTQAAATIRSIPLRRRGEKHKTLVLMRDVSDLRRREQALLGKDATIREIHHRVKNNLQTVASLLRIQGRRLNDEAAQAAISEAVRRVATISVVHDLLAHNPDETVDFDEVAHRIIALTIETSEPKPVNRNIELTFGLRPTEQATPLALAIAELVANAIEHGANEDGSVNLRVTVNSSEHAGPEGMTIVSVADDGQGMPLDPLPTDGLGLAIVTTLVNDELHGEITFNHVDVSSQRGTIVTIAIPNA